MLSGNIYNMQLLDARMNMLYSDQQRSAWLKNSKNDKKNMQKKKQLNFLGAAAYQLGNTISRTITEVKQR